MNKTKLYALANELAVSSQKFINIPYGRWPFGDKKLQDGGTVHFDQELSLEGARILAGRINAAVAKGEKGVPIYWGHPDEPALAHKYPDKRAKGWIRHANATGTELTLAVDWLEERPTEGFGFFSPYWTGKAEAAGPGRQLVRVDELISVGLVNLPNIRDFRLANELQGAIENPNKGDTHMDRALLIQTLALDENASDEDIVAAIEKLKSAAKDAETKAEAAKAEAQTAEEALANEKALSRKLLLDQAVAEGRISPAGRAAWEKRLEADFKAGALALANEKPLKLVSAVAVPPGRTAGVSLVALANEKMRLDPTLSYAKAFAMARADHPEIS